MEQDYLIAGHRIKVENETLMHAMDRMSGFEVFKVNNKDEDTFRFDVQVFSNGSAIISVTPTNRQNITYQGELAPKKED